MQDPTQCFVIDNDEDDREIVEMVLREINPAITCKSASNGIQALQMLADVDFSPSIVFIDMNMPMMTGTQCLKSIRAMERFRQTPVYILSTSSDPYAIEEAKQLGANDFLVKPFSFDSWVTLLSSVFQLQNP